MANALDRLLAAAGKNRTDFAKGTKLGGLFRSAGVANTPELQRIMELPEYRWQDDAELPEVGRFIDQTYGKGMVLSCRRTCGHEKRQLPGVCAECDRAKRACLCMGEGTMSVRDLQSAALSAIHDLGGLLGPIRVGGGKTLISYLAGPMVEAERVLLVIPAKLKGKTQREFAKLARHWVGPKRLHIMSYELLARDRGVAELKAYRPDLIIADEAHKLKNGRASCTKRIRRYIEDESPECGYVDMSGTITKRSIMEFYHRQKWALQEPLQPLPRGYNEARDWADAIDVRVSPTGRLLPGALFQLYTAEELQEAAGTESKAAHVRIVRGAFRRRLTSTPGVVATEEMFDGAMGIQLSWVEWPVGEVVRQAFTGLRERWELPDGHPIEEPPQLWFAARCLIQGFYMRWDPPPPAEWLFYRKEWSRACREILANYRDIDSPFVAVREVERGRIEWARPILKAWQDIRPTFTPNSKAFWIDDGAFNFCKAWAAQGPGIIWVNEVALGERLYREAGIPYYGEGGVCGKKPIEDEYGACVASVGSNVEGRNLQQFSRNLVAGPPPGGALWEQMVGRTHRDGQEADEVTFEVPLGCYENWDVMQKALADAEFIERTTGQNQKLNFADVTLPDPGEIEELCEEGDPCWSKANAVFFQSDDFSGSEVNNSMLTVEQRAQRRRDAYAGAVVTE